MLRFIRRSGVWFLFACSITAPLTFAQPVGYMQGTSWVATTVEGADQPYKVYQDPPTPCAFRMQMNYGEHSDQMGYAIQMTSLNCTSISQDEQSSLFPKSRDLMTFYVDDAQPDTFVAFGITSPDNKNEVEEGQFAFSDDKKAFRLVRDLRSDGDPNVTRQRFRVRFNDVNEPTSGTVVLETRRGLDWETNATIELAPWGEKPEGVWGAPYGSVVSPVTGGTPGCRFLGSRWQCS